MKSDFYKIKWHLNVKRPDYILNLSLVALSDLRYLKKVTDLGYSSFLAVLENNLAITYAPLDEVTRQTSLLSKNLKKAKGLIGLKKFYQDKLEKTLLLLERKTADQTWIIKDFRAFIEAYCRFITFRITTRVLGYANNLPKRFVREVGQSRLEFKEEWLLAKKTLEKIWRNIARGFRVKIIDLKAMTLDELMACLKKRDFARFSGIAKIRSGKVVIMGIHAKIKLYTGKKARQLSRMAEEELPASDKQIVGNPAFPGKATGIVKVLSAAGRVKPGKKFILVTSMTTPDFVPLLKHVRGIVTDEGGLTCHAAIISREMRIPCIVGTKIATQVLKDGMIVEVDANLGLVKIIK